MLRYNWCLLIAVISLFGGVVPSLSYGQSALELEKYIQEKAASPEDYIVEKFKTKDVLLLSEDHAIKHNLQLIINVIPKLYKAGVYAVGMEFGAYEDQQLLDSLITAPAYNEALARKIMFSYNVGWAYKEYTDVYKAAWELNHSLPYGARKFRILNISYKFNWTDCDTRTFGIRTIETYSRVFNKGNTEFFRASVIKKEVLDKKEKILVICGFGHAYSKYHTPYFDYREENFYRLDNNRMGNILYRLAPKKVFTILLHYPFESKTLGYTHLLKPADGAIDKVMEKFPNKRVGFDLAGSPFGKLRDTSFYSIGHAGFKLSDMADGYIYERPFDTYEGCTIDSLFLTDQNWPEVIKNFPDKDVDKLPATKELYLERIGKYTDLKWRYRNIKN